MTARSRNAPCAIPANMTDSATVPACSIATARPSFAADNRLAAERCGNPVQTALHPAAIARPAASRPRRLPEVIPNLFVGGSGPLSGRASAAPRGRTLRSAISFSNTGATRIARRRKAGPISALLAVRGPSADAANPPARILESGRARYRRAWRCAPGRRKAALTRRCPREDARPGCRGFEPYRKGCR